MNQLSRLSRSLSFKSISLEPPFSNFQFLEEDDLYQSIPSLKRLFSLARSKKCSTAVIEDIESQGALLSEKDCLESVGVQNKAIRRISFWTCEIGSEADIESAEPEKLQGYLILKSDVYDVDDQRGHVFEAVFRKYEHRHNFIPHNNFFEVDICNKHFSVDGVMYCQQNSKNKACAQVALRSLLCRIQPENDFYYEELQRVSGSTSNPANGLDSMCIRAVLDHYKVNYFDLVYQNPTDSPEDDQACPKDDQACPEDKPVSPKDFPYDKWIYPGIECGFGSLVGFELGGPKAEGAHIIPFFGHTFNQDTWAPRAGNAYFKVGANTQYFSSEQWLSSFIGHDDNFGPNFCVPRRFLEPEQVKYVVSLMPDGVSYDGVTAEVLAIDALYSTLQNLPGGDDCFWFRQLRIYTQQKDIVLRATVMLKEEYVKHLTKSQDWQQNLEDKEAIELIEQVLPDLIWMVEVSIPELFSTNYSKLGEIILDASMAIDEDQSNRGEAFIMARFPRNYYVNAGDGITFNHLPSLLESHVLVIGVNEPQS